MLSQISSRYAGVMTFPWANNNTPVPLTAHDLMAAAEAAEASMRQLSLGTEVPLPNFSPRQPASSLGLPGASNGHSVGGVQRQVSVGIDSTGKPVGALRGLSIDQPGEKLGFHIAAAPVTGDILASVGVLTSAQLV